MEQIVTNLTPATKQLYLALVEISGEESFLRAAMYIVDGDDECEIDGFREKSARIAFYHDNKPAFTDWMKEEAEKKDVGVDYWLVGLDYPRVGCEIDKTILSSVIFLEQPHKQAENIVDSVVREFLLHISKIFGA